MFDLFYIGKASRFTNKFLLWREYNSTFSTPFSNRYADSLLGYMLNMSQRIMIRIPDSLLYTKSNRSWFKPMSIEEELVLILASSHSSAVRSVYTNSPFMVANTGADDPLSWQVVQVISITGRQVSRTYFPWNISKQLGEINIFSEKN